jgi:hypothetical protein
MTGGTETRGVSLREYSAVRTCEATTEIYEGIYVVGRLIGLLLM